MQGVTMLKNVGAMTDFGSYAREPVGIKRRARREFWRAFRRETRMVIADQLDEGAIPPVANVFTAMAQADAEQAYLWDEEIQTQARLTELRKKREWLLDALHEVNENIESHLDHLDCVQQGFCCCYRQCL